MATFSNPNQNLSFSIPSEGELFLGTDPNFLYKRQGDQVFHSFIPSGFNTQGLNKYNSADVRTAFDSAGREVNYRKFDPGLFTNQLTGTGNVSVANDPNLQSYLAAAGKQGIPLANADLTGLEGISPPKVNSSLLVSSQTPPFLTTTPSPVFPVNTISSGQPTAQSGGLLAPGTTLTQPQAQAQSLYSQIAQLEQGLSGESAFRSGLNRERHSPSVEDLERSQGELSTQLRQLQLESQAIPLQIQNSAGAVSAGLIQRQTEQALRENAIKVLTTSALLEANRGNLALAYDRVDRAVNERYGPIKEEIEIKRKNLELLMQSPLFRQAEKDAASEQLQTQSLIRAQIDQLETNQRDVLKIATDAAAGGAPPLVLRQITSARTANDALITAGPYLAKASNQSGAVGGFDFTGDIQKQNALDSQTVSSAFTSIQGTLAKYGLTPETLTVKTANQLNDTDIIAIGKAVARMQNPDIARMGGDTGNIFAPTSFTEIAKQYFRAGFTGKQYLPSKVVDAVSNAVALHKARMPGMPMNTPQPGVIIRWHKTEKGWQKF